MVRDFAINNVYDAIDGKASWEEWSVEKINSALNNRVLPAEANFVNEDMIEGLEVEELADIVANKAVEIYEAKCKALAEIRLEPQRIEREILLRVVDSLWRDHIDFMEVLRSEIGLRAYGNHDPIIAFKKESSQAYEKMITRMREETAMFLINFKVQIERKVPVNFSVKKPTEEQMKQLHALAMQKKKELEAAGKVENKEEPVKVAGAENEQANAELEKLMKAPSNIEMVTNSTEKTQAKKQGKLVGRNDPCPCGSGKKYKQCCGKDNK
jgi:preprotein translocase subunit SecA